MDYVKTQFFSPKALVDTCVSLIKNKNGRLLEPSCGDGSFLLLKNSDSVFIEIDKSVITDPDVLNIDFFDYSIKNKFDTICGNPPYLDNADFIFDSKTYTPKILCKANLYLYFIEKSYEHLNARGEIIFIVPREFIKLTSAKMVNELLMVNGTITHYYDYGDQMFWKDASPNICIFRYEKGNMSHKTITLNGKFNSIINNGIISFIKNENSIRLGDLFTIKVGSVAGNDYLFENEKGDDFVFSETCKTGKTKKMIFQKYDKSLEEHKDILINRKIRNDYDETNWWMWGRPVNHNEGNPRIYVNCRTRNKLPFFLNPCDKWDGSVLALFPKFKVNLVKATEMLNSIDWELLGLKSGDRFLFSQKALQEAPCGMTKLKKIFGDTIVNKIKTNNASACQPNLFLKEQA
ncbi:DNA methyltransferase [Spirochaetia bacterium]|nr:DNA methyltransferase [Spirochaetia bacterium]